VHITRISSSRRPFIAVDDVFMTSAGPDSVGPTKKVGGGGEAWKRHEQCRRSLPAPLGAGDFLR
jgi:hypothetical protein